MPPQEKPATVLIVGASFAGLAAAWWMNQLGYAVTLVEIAKSVKKGGTPVNIRDGVIEVVRRMGLLERIIAQRLPPRSTEFLDGNGHPVAQGAAEWSNPENDPEEYEIERDALLDLLFDAVKANVECLFDRSIVTLEPSPEQVTVSFTDGTRRPFSLILGCDGTHSAVRKICFGKESLFSLFMHNYFSLTIVDKLLIEQDTHTMFLTPGRTVMLSAYNGRTDIAFCFFSDREIAYDRRDRAQQKQMVLQAFAGHGWRIPELLGEMSGHEDFYFDKLCQIRMSSWSKGRVALVGDAAYCPSPTAGMGGSMAILGAAALADALQKHPTDLPLAFAEYDRSFRPIAEAIQDDAIRFGLEMIMPGSLAAIEADSRRLRPAHLTPHGPAQPTLAPSPSTTG